MSHPPQASSQGVRFPAVTQRIDPVALSLTVGAGQASGRGGVTGRPQDGGGREDGGRQLAGRDQGPEGSGLSVLSTSSKLGPESDGTPF